MMVYNLVSSQSIYKVINCMLSGELHYVQPNFIIMIIEIIYFLLAVVLEDLFKFPSC